MSVSERGPFHDRDFELDDESRNVVGFSSDGTIQWIVPKPDAPAEQSASPFKRLYELDSVPYIKNGTHRLYRLNAVTGELTGSWPADQLPLGSSIAELDGEIQLILDDGDCVFVRCLTGETDLYAFDKAGTERWHSTGRRGKIFLEDSVLYERVARGPRTEDWYRVDKETGERLELVEYPL